MDCFVFRWRFQQVKEKCRHWCSTICGARKPKWMWTGFPYWSPYKWWAHCCSQKILFDQKSLHSAMKLPISLGVSTTERNMIHPVMLTGFWWNLQLIVATVQLWGSKTTVIQKNILNQVFFNGSLWCLIIFPNFSYNAVGYGTQVNYFSSPLTLLLGKIPTGDELNDNVSHLRKTRLILAASGKEELACEWRRF